METVSSAPTIKQRRKFERIETSDINNQDASSVNHVPDVDAINTLSKCVHQDVQTLADCCKESMKKRSLQEDNNYRRKHSDSMSQSSVRENYPKMSRTLMCIISATPFVINIVVFPIMYTMCILESHAGTYALYISDTGLVYPEASIATQFLNMIAFTVFLTVLMRYLLLQQYLRDGGEERLSKTCVNVVLWTGIITSFCIQIIANFPAVNFGNMCLHSVAVIAFFISITTVSIIEIWITYQTIGVLCDRRISYLRFTILSLQLVSSTITSITAPISWYQFNGEDYRKWQPSDDGWVCRVISVIGEWLFVMFSNLYLLTFTYECRFLTIYMPVVKIRYLSVKEKTKS